MRPPTLGEPEGGAHHIVQARETDDAAPPLCGIFFGGYGAHFRASAHHRIGNVSLRPEMWASAAEALDAKTLLRPRRT